jgi:hypothetical protein
MTPALIPIILAVGATLTIATPSSKAQAPSSYGLLELPANATLRNVTAAPAQYKGRRALKVELTRAANKGQPGVDYRDKPTFVYIPPIS